MKVYTSRPTARRARDVWDYISWREGREPAELWKNPNCWGGPRLAGNAWGWWVAEFVKVGGTYDEVRSHEFILPFEI